MTPADLAQYARLRVIETCEAQGVPVEPDADTLAAAAAVLALAPVREVIGRAAA